MSGARAPLRTRSTRPDSPPVNWYADPQRSGYERAIEFTPGFGMDPAEIARPSSQRYGRSSMTMRWLLRGTEGVAQFLMSTGWTPEAAPADPRWPSLRDWMVHSPSGFDLGYHARAPQYEGAEQYGTQPREYLGEPCWYDGSGLAADDVLAAFFDRGEEGVWEALYERLRTLVAPGADS